MSYQQTLNRVTIIAGVANLQLSKTDKTAEKSKKSTNKRRKDTLVEDDDAAKVGRENVDEFGHKPKSIKKVRDKQLT